jgi:hypothetical protein
MVRLNRASARQTAVVGGGGKWSQAGPPGREGAAPPQRRLGAPPRRRGVGLRQGTGVLVGTGLQGWKNRSGGDDRPRRGGLRKQGSPRQQCEKKLKSHYTASSQLSQLMVQAYSNSPHTHMSRSPFSSHPPPTRRRSSRKDARREGKGLYIGREGLKG